MYTFDSPAGMQNDESDSGASTYTMLVLFASFSVGMLALAAKYAESNNRLNYESRLARIIAGALVFIINMWHTKADDLTINNTEKDLIAIGPHCTSVEALVVASKMKGNPPQFLATTNFNSIPGIASTLKMFKTIPVEGDKAKASDGRSANFAALERASQALNENGCVVLFPQGNFRLLGKEPPMIYSGAAKLAIEHKIPVKVLGLSGIWCVNNSLLPVWLRDNKIYRALFSLIHMNNIKVTECGTIEFHLLEENKDLSEEEKIRGICAELYSHFRHFEISDKELKVIKKEIADKTHLTIWDTKVRVTSLERQLLSSKKELAQLEEPTAAGMSLSS
ncbi:lysophospholipid acyltransferase family protein [Legionella genomosp. 1]|uniref:lysophospholipid acyltransferase family protein n=1 Tax=Legionella genomosp. 1 TaxID=1093625 RepID=UPI0021CAE76A|nr:1-acyl-sn-glycerol-3-phosphate acyltransferase [Legionella genomosp. 1]